MKKRETRIKLKMIYSAILCILLIGTIAYATNSCPPHNLVYGSWSSNSESHYRTTSCTKCNHYSTNYFSHNYCPWEVTVDPDCTDTGIERRWCNTCGYGQSRAVDALGHSWSGWQTNETEHWKICNTCKTTGSKGNHVDNDVNGYCDSCNYLMAIPAKATISGAVSVKVGASASFSISVTEGTEPIEYQWYYNTSNSTSGGTPVSGAKSTTLTINTTTKNMNGRYYYCEMKNKAGTKTSPTALLTVYYPFTIGTQPNKFELKKGESALFSVGIGEKGNPDKYNYQWYVASTVDGTGNRIAGATSSSYQYTPTSNIHEAYYYCVVNNGQYEATSNRAKLVADITSPIITMGTFNQNLIINKDVTLTIPFTVNDTGEGYTENGANFTKEDFVIKTDGVTNTNVVKNLTYNVLSNNTVNYTLTISNMTGNGKLSLEVPANLIEDNFHNKNATSTFNTNVTVDNKPPVVSVESVISGVNDRYANSEKTIEILLAVTEAVGINTSEFTKEDIIVKVGGSILGSELSKNMNYSRKEGNKYLYELTLTNVTGNGELVLEINEDSMRDLANNPNAFSSLPVLIGGNNVLIDNTPPEIQSVVTTFDSYMSSRYYPTSLDPKHQGWAKEDIYVQVNATDEQKIDYYTESKDKITYNKMNLNQECISLSTNAEKFYRVYDMAGNYTEISEPIIIKLDKIPPKPPVMLLTEQRENGAAYIFNKNEPSSKTIYVKPNPATIVDFGDIQSGININDSSYPYTFYYTIKRYKDIDKVVELGETVRYEFGDVARLRESGYYVIEAFMSDIAGNELEKVTYEVYINKGVENTIRIKNINDIGSGISTVIINVYDEDNNLAISEIVIDNPYREIIRNVRLREGKFKVEVKLIDKVGNTKFLTTTITNVF